MPGPQPDCPVSVKRKQRKLLKQILRCRTTPQCLVWRIQIILMAAKGYSNSQIARLLSMSRCTVQKWRARWCDAQSTLASAEEEGLTRSQWKCLLREILSDAPRSGSPGTFTPEQLVRIIAVACEPPEQSGRPVTHWTPSELAEEVVQRDIVESISARTVGRVLSEGDVKPHLSRYWLNATPEDPDVFHAEVRTVCALYQQAVELHAAGVHLMSTDEKTGIQALERAADTLPMRPGQVERREYEYIRHGTQCLIANLEVATGRIVAASVTPTRTEQDFVAHIAQTVATDPDAEWVFITDQLNTHQSESLVCWVAATCGINEELGVKGKQGILQCMKTRKAFLEDATHRVRFVYTPKHTSWLNQIEIWFSILVRRVLKRGNFASVEALKQRLLAFIDYFNEHLAKPFRWTYAGKPLAA